jgi:hypothetical protein
MKKFKDNIRIIPTIPNLNIRDKWAKMLPGCISHIKNQDVQGITLMEPYVTPDTDMDFSEGKMSKLEAITDRINACIDYFMEKTDATHVWLVDGDIEVPKHALRYLLELDVDIASGIYSFHNEKYSMMFGKMRDESVSMAEQEKTNKFNPHGLIGLPQDYITGSENRVGGGNGCLLMKRRVFGQYHPNIKPLRFVNNYKDLGSDLYFWYRAQNAGFTCRIHWQVLAGHLPQWPLSCYKEDYKEKLGMELNE